MALILTPLATDNFAPNANPLNPANWTQYSDSGAYSGSLRAVSGQALGQSADVGGFDGNYYSAIVTPDDQFVTATLAQWIKGNGQEADILLRSDPTGDAVFYDMYILDNADGLTAAVLVVNQDNSVFYENDSVTVNAGDVFTFAVIGSTGYISQNGVFVDPFPVSGADSGAAGLLIFNDVGTTDCSWSNFIMGSAALSSGAYSQPDCRVTKPNSATGETVNGTILYDSQTSSNPAIPPTDSRVSKPVACGTYPQNSRTPGTYGPGE
jgi:hypothetical protein